MRPYIKEPKLAQHFFNTDPSELQEINLVSHDQPLKEWNGMDQCILQVVKASTSHETCFSYLSVCVYVHLCMN